MADPITWAALLESVGIKKPLAEAKPALVQKGDGDQAALFLDDAVLAERDEQSLLLHRFVTALSAAMFNLEISPDAKKGFLSKQVIEQVMAQLDELIARQIDGILHSPNFQVVESAWTSLRDLVKETDFKANIRISLIDATKAEVGEDLVVNAGDIAGAELFKKVYVAEYDRYGGEPYGGLIGLYEFGKTADDIEWLESMGKVCAAGHAPFIAAASPQFFGLDRMSDLTRIRSVGGLLQTAAYGAWQKFRKSQWAVYIGLTLPRYVARLPYDPDVNPARGLPKYKERVDLRREEDFVWGNASMLFARNLVRSFAGWGWCQYIRGPRGGGLIEGLPTYVADYGGELEMRLPVEVAIPDYQEWDLAQAGFNALIHKKGTGDAVFFSAQSLKYAEEFEDPVASENAQVVTNLSYTFSISRIAHYLKTIMRNNIGTSADALYVQGQVDRWVARYVTTLVNPDDLTLRYYPFKGYSLTVAEVPGRVGWYHCELSIQPHIQFEGVDVDLRVVARLS